MTKKRLSIAGLLAVGTVGGLWLVIVIVGAAAMRHSREVVREGR